MSFCEALQARRVGDADRPALRDHGTGIELTWADYGAEVERVARGLAALGVTRGDTVALMLRNRPVFNVVDAAAMHLGAVPWSIYNTSAPGQVADLLGRAGSRVMICEPEFAGHAGGRAVEHVVTADAIADLPEAPAAFDFEAAWRSVTDDDVLTIIFTSGTTGAPKGVELTHGGMRAALETLTTVAGVSRGGRSVSYLPAAHVADRWSAHYWPMLLGTTVTCVADGAEVMQALPAVRPTIWGSVPRVFEKLHAVLVAGGLHDPAALGDADREAVHRGLGLDAVEVSFVGAAPLPVATLEYFDALDLPLCEVWGLSESCGLLTVNHPGAQRIGTVGPPLPDVELRIAEDGEVLARAPQLMRGYRGDPELTARTIDADGWLHTGDVGRLDEHGHLTIVDRKKEIIVNSAGKNMSPLAIEAVLKSSGPLIGQACAIGDRRPYVSALLVLDPAAAAPEEEEELLAAIQTEVDAANGQLSRVEHVRRWVLLRQEWLPDGDELTATMKLKRKPIVAKYASAIEELYA